MAKVSTPFQGVMTGRIVQGDPFVAQTKDQQGNLRVVKTGPNIGQPSPQWFIAVAFAKNDPYWPTFMNALLACALTEWPTLFQPNPAFPVGPMYGIMMQPPANPLFSFKVKDGDGIDRQGKSNATKEGFAGHWVVSFASAYAPKVVRPTGPNTWEQLSYDPASGAKAPIKRGDYVRVAGSIAGNDNTQNPGLYVNLGMIELVGTGVEIQNGPDAATAFATPASLPAGATALGAIPMGNAQLPAPIPIMLPAAQGQTYAAMIAAGWTDATLLQHGMMLAPVAAPPPPPPVVAAPPPPPPPPPVVAAPPPPPPVVAAPPPPPVVPSGPVMTAKAAGQTYEAMVAAGWTDATLVEHGMIEAHAGFRTPPLTVAPIVAPPPPPPSAPVVTGSPTRTMTAAANGATYESFVAQGWTDDALISQGYMVIAY